MKGGPQRKALFTIYYIRIWSCICISYAWWFPVGSILHAWERHWLMVTCKLAPTHFVEIFERSMTWTLGNLTGSSSTTTPSLMTNGGNPVFKMFSFICMVANRFRFQTPGSQLWTCSSGSSHASLFLGCNFPLIISYIWVWLSFLVPNYVIKHPSTSTPTGWGLHLRKNMPSRKTWAERAQRAEFGPRNARKNPQNDRKFPQTSAKKKSSKCIFLKPWQLGSLPQKRWLRVSTTFHTSVYSQIMCPLAASALCAWKGHVLWEIPGKLGINEMNHNSTLIIHESSVNF